MEQTKAQRDAAISHAVIMLECDTKLMTSPLTKGYLWFVHIHFPFPAYIHIFQELRRRPGGGHAKQTWEIISNNYEAHFMTQEQNDNPFIRIIGKLVVQAWEARELLSSRSEKSLVPPRIVSDIRLQVAQSTQDAQNDVEQSSDFLGMSIDDFPMSMPMDFDGHGTKL